MRTLFRWLRRALAAVVVLLLLAAAAVAASVWLSMPGRGGDAVIAGLGAPVSVTLDADGVPRIQAASEVDAAAALGWLHARERMFQMELMRRAAAGELSELFGAATLPIDRLMRTLGLRMHAASDLPGLPADTRKLLDAYARGVNAFIDSRSAGRARGRRWTACSGARPCRCTSPATGGRSGRGWCWTRRCRRRRWTSYGPTAAATAIRKRG
jgi:penicillin amidase